MSAGAFEFGKYEANDAKVWSVRVQPETKAFTSVSTPNDYAAGSITQGIGRLKTRKSPKALGVHPRNITVAFGTDVPTGYEANAIEKITVFTSAAWDAYLVGNTGTYLDKTVTIVGKFPEFTK
jgi:hypothetical protein